MTNITVKSKALHCAGREVEISEECVDALGWPVGQVALTYLMVEGPAH